MKNFPAKIQRILDEGYDFRFGHYINQGFNIALKNIGGYIGFFLVYFALSFASLLIPIIGTLALMVVYPALMIGTYHVAHLIANGNNNQFGDFFKGFDKFGPLFLTTLLTILLVIAAIIPGAVLLGVGMFGAFSNLGSSNLEGYGGGEEAFVSSLLGNGNLGLIIAGLLLYLLPAIYLSISFVWAPMLVWFHGLDPWPALMASRKITAKNWWITLIFFFVIGIISVAGAIALGVGILLTLPAMLCAQYAAFADITRLNEDPSEGDVIDHFVLG
jgi:hypothetical protein